MFDRRQLLQQSSLGFGWLAFSALQAQEAKENPLNPLSPKQPHFPAKAKHVIFMFMQGGPSHLETFDWKPELAKAGGRYLAPQFEFKPCGKSGLMIADVLPEIGKVADELCLINGMQGTNPGHQQAIVSLHTGSENFVRPSFGAWITYGLGSASMELPGFVTIDPISDLGGAMNYGSAFLPASYQGTRISSSQSSLPNSENFHLAEDDQMRQIEFIQKANRRLMAKTNNDPQIEGIIQSYELGFKMQASVPEVLDLSKESDATMEAYGINGPSPRFGSQCLMARRLVEKGVRFVQVTQSGWDHHNNIKDGITRQAGNIDKPIAALIADLKASGKLSETLIIWGGEFGRGTHQDNTGGRGHNNKGFTVMLAGGGVKGGINYGATDELGGAAVEKVMPTVDLHATILHLLGLSHTKLTYRYAGRDFRLTDVKGEVHKDIIA